MTTSIETQSIALQINGSSQKLSTEPRVSLLDALRDHLHLTGTKKGCDQGACGACTVLADGERINSCLAFAIRDDSLYQVRTSEGDVATSKTVIIATGVSYRLLDVEGSNDLLASGVCYNATAVEARMCKDWPVHVIGGGNSSGQAAMFLTQYARKVTLVVRGGDLRKSMSSYLCDRVAANPKIEVRYHTQVTAIEGTEHIGAVHLRDADELQKFFTSHLKPYLNYPFRKESHSVGYSAILLLLRRPACSLPVSGSTR